AARIAIWRRCRRHCGARSPTRSASCRACGRTNWSPSGRSACSRMASSRRPAPETGAAEVHETLARWLDALADDPRILVATSGGLDSMVLLDGLARLVPATRLHAGHVDHALQPESAGRADFVLGQAQAAAPHGRVPLPAGRTPA